MKVDENLSSGEKRTLLAMLLEKRVRKRAPVLAPESGRAQGLKRFATSSSEMREEVVLDPSIRFDAPLTQRVAKPAGILLTGATGFLGAFLLDELLKRTGAKIYCLVRCPDLETGRQRIQATLAKYLSRNGWNNPRIIPVAGDLTQSLFGLSTREFEKLAEAVDCVYHNGALVKLCYNYELLKPTNVLGTQEVIRLASLGRLKPLHYISTVAACPLKDSSEVQIVRETELDFDGMLYGGYCQSKWVAEQMVIAARARGLPVGLYRPGIITGHSQTGACNTADATWRMIKVIVETGVFSEIEGAMDMTPVDYVSKAIVHMACSGRAIGQTYHLVNPKPMSLKNFGTWLRNYGYPFRRIPYEAWRAEMLALAARPDKELLSSFIMPFLNTEASNKMPGWLIKMKLPSSRSGVDQVLSTVGARYGTQVQWDCRNALQGLVGTDIVCPPIDDRLLNIYFSYLIRTGYLHPPTQ